MNQNLNYPFQPKIGSEEIVLIQDNVPGTVYFTTDTRKIYLDIDEHKNKQPMGGNVGLFYGQMKLIAPPTDGQEEFEFAITDIVGNESGKNMLYPNVDDLILNSDGCFYKVTDRYGIDVETVLTTKKLTIAGSGGGGGSSSDPDSLAGMGLSRLRSDNGSTILYQSACPISFAVKVTDDLGDALTGIVGVYDLYIDNIKKASGSVHGCTTDTPIKDFGKLNLDLIDEKELNVIDVGKYLPLKENIAVKISVTSLDGQVSTRNVNVSTTDMTLTWDYDETTKNFYDATHQDMELSWKVSGNIEKTTHIIINDDIAHEITITSSLVDQSHTLRFQDYNLTHGAHKIEMYVSASVGGGTTRTPSIFKNIIVIEDSTTAIISVGLFEKELTQYNTIKIPILIYDSNNSGDSAIVTLWENGNLKDTWTNVKNLDNTRFWAYTPTVSGITTLIVKCNGVEKSFTITVKGLNINLNETAGYAFKFKANEFASNSNVLGWSSNGINATFSDNFDWINGGLKSETAEDGNSRQFVTVKAGSTMTINYSMFKETAKTLGKSFKIIFKATNCRDYDARLLSCKRDKKIISTSDVEKYFVIDNGETLSHSAVLNINDNSVVMVNAVSDIFDLTSKENRDKFNEQYVNYNDKVYLCKIKKVEGSDNVYYAVFFETYVEDTFEGFVMNAQNASFKSRNSTISTQYCEDSYIELELDIAKEDPSGIKNYITFWIDGVPSGFVIYDTSDSFIDSTNQKIVIGSEDCDVQIYAIKMYEKSLSNEQHLQNFIADASGATEIVSRYNRNNILDERNEISPGLLAKANPECHVNVYEVERMPKTKKTKINGCKFAQYLGSDQAHLTADNVTIKVQGTSSEKYVVSAANLDSDFKDGFMDANGTKMNGWSMSANSIPIDYVCTKVNVASCENANNALNQEWYNMFQPYQSVLRCKNPKARDTMEFVNGVLFIQDNNDTFTTTGTYDAKDNNVFGETVGYLSKPYPKFYSLANMGNSKDNVHVFHDTENPLECCVEVSDNQEPQQWMVTDDYSDSEIDGEDIEYYSFRYPDGAENATQAMKDNWRTFVSWMAHSNPQPKYKQHKATNEKEFKSFSYIQKTNKTIPVWILNEDENRYDLISSFDPNIDTYYTETENVYGYTNLRLENPQSFDSYTFRGYKANETIQSQYTPLIKGCTVSEYATKRTVYEYQKDEDGHLIYDQNNQPIPIGPGEVRDVPYTHDTYEYRMAKMLSECENYLCMDSVIYHYLFIERHCMIDNVAKNTFWSTEDGRVWNLIKDYDNDTADGNDNNGKFTRTYGMEPLDKLNANVYVFNAHQSVWFNFINGLKEACEWMYQQLENKTVTVDNRKLRLWNKDDYLWFFNKWQSKIPERCWIEDYNRKYHRPYEVYGDNMFNSMMEGGQKKHQRAQYETYQDIYMSSKYFGTACQGAYSVIRGNGENLLGHQLPVTTYSDCYIHTHVGSAKNIQRVKRNEVNYLVCPVNDINNATVYFYPVNVFSTVGDVNGGQVGAYLPEQISFSGANKLKELVISATAEGAEDIPNESLINSFSVTNNKLLEKLYVENLTKYDSHLDLTSCPNLRELDARNSTFTAISIADGAPVEKIWLYNPTALNFSNLRKVTELNISNYNRLSILNLHNVDDSPAISSKNLVQNSTFLDNYKLTDVKWTIDDNSEISNNKINILEFLLSKSPIETSQGIELQENSLTGDLDITANGYNAGSAGALAIYDNYAKAKLTYEQVIYASKDMFEKDTRKKYVFVNGQYVEDTEEYDSKKVYYIEKLMSEYPNLDIEFLGNNAQLYTVYIYDGDGNVFWKRKTITGTLIDKDFLTYGPKGSFKSASLYKSKTEQYEYNFLNKWTVKDDTGKTLTTIETAEPLGITVNGNVHLYPVFETKTRQYKITFKVKNPVTKEIIELKQEKDEEETLYPYGTPLADVLPKNTIPYVNIENLPLLHVYDFVGYSLTEDSTIRVPDTYTVNGDATFWAIFELKENARKVVHPEWFKVQAFTYLNQSDTLYHNSVGVVLSPKYETLGGKITIPAEVEVEGTMIPVIGIRGFGSATDSSESNYKITHVFMEEGKENKLYEIQTASFRNCYSLIYFDFDNCAVRRIGAEAFKRAINLTNTSFGKQVYQILNYAFNQAIKAYNAVITLPGTLVSLGEYSLSVLGIVGSEGTEYPRLDIGTQENPSPLVFLKNINGALQQNSGHYFKTINFYSSVYKTQTDRDRELDKAFGLEAMGGRTDGQINLVYVEKN